MVSYRKCNIMAVALTITILITLNVTGVEKSENRDTARSAGMQYMSNGMYDKAIQEFEKVSREKDYKLQEALISCYLKVGKFNNASRVALALKDNKEYQKDNLYENLAKVFLDSLEDCNADIHCCFERLMVAGKFALGLYPGNATRRKVGLIQKKYAAEFEKNSAGYEQLIKAAAAILGERHASGFEIEKINRDTYKVTFFTRRVISVFEQEKDYYLTIIDVSNPIKVLKYYPDISKTLPVDMGTKTEITMSMPLEFKAEKGEFVIFKYERN